jgi:hypothetical protein
VGKLALVLLLAGFGPMAFAGKRVNIEQVEQLLASARNLPDAKLAEKLSGLELVERATSARLSRWQKDFPGARTREALLALADASAFLDLPPTEILPNAEPDTETLVQIYARAIAYASKTIQKLPDFSARRTTLYFDDLSVAQRVREKSTSDGSRVLHASGAQGVLPPGAALLRDGDASSLVVTYRDGNEVEDTASTKSKKSESRGSGLTTFGEFGPIISVVIGDAKHGKVYWSHWEQGANGPLAVFRYRVPQESSHFMVKGGGNIPQCPSYHGEIAVDPASGTILRITLESDWKPPFQPSESNVLVEYGPVQIGNQTYTCPIKGVALSKLPDPSAQGTNASGDMFAAQTFVNDITFTEYHVFRAETRILP